MAYKTSEERFEGKEVVVRVDGDIYETTWKAGRIVMQRITKMRGK